MRPKKAPPESFTVRHELEKLAARLAGDGWKTKLIPEFTPIEDLAYRRSHAAAERGDQVALQEQWNWMMFLSFSGEVILEYSEDSEMQRWARNGVLLFESPLPQPVPADWVSPEDDE
jgi:hypothetical protein